MERYESRFAELARKSQGAFVPFTVLGDPDPETGLEIMEAFVAGGADMLELGIPFSDPIADGPAIQGADLRALAAGTTPATALEIVAAFRRRHPDLPIGLLLYANLVQRAGPAAFIRRAVRAGVDSMLLADLPPEEAREFRRPAAAAGMGMVSMVTPLTRDDRLAAILAAGGPYLYVVSRSGVTGADARLAASAAPLLRRIARHADIPTLLGFGISKPAQLAEAIAAGASGGISGSAIVKIIAKHVNAASRGGLKKSARRELCDELRRFVSRMKAATGRSGSGKHAARAGKTARDR